MAPQRLRVGPVRGPTVVGVLAAGVLITALVIAGRSLNGAPGRSAAQRPASPTAAAVPLSLGPTWTCPLAAPVPGFVDRRSYPPGAATQSPAGRVLPGQRPGDRGRLSAGAPAGRDAGGRRRLPHPHRQTAPAPLPAGCRPARFPGSLPRAAAGHVTRRGAPGPL